MPNAIEVAIDTYIRAWRERDAAARAQLLEACFAEDGRFVTRWRVVRGRAALAAEMASFHARSQWRSIRLASAVDTGATSFRYRGAVEFQDGKVAEAFDAGEVDATGKISLLLTFDGPLGDTTPRASR
jgi:hypothetical protein